MRLIAVNERGRRIGEDHPHARLTNAEVELLLEIREREGWSYTRLARKFDIAKTTARDYIKGRRRCQTVMGFKEISQRRSERV